jgi:hypothetical protein
LPSKELRGIRNPSNEKALEFPIDIKPLCINGRLLEVQQPLDPKMWVYVPTVVGPEEPGNSLWTEERDGVIYEVHGFCMDAWLGKEEDYPELPACLDRRGRQ